MRADSNILVTAGLLWLGISIILGAVLLGSDARAEAGDSRVLLECVVIDPAPSPCNGEGRRNGDIIGDIPDCNGGGGGGMGISPYYATAGG